MRDKQCGQRGHVILNKCPFSSFSLPGQDNWTNLTILF